MPQSLTGFRQMAGRKKENFDRRRVEFMAEPAWIERVTKVAEHLGLNLSAFIRMAVTQHVDRIEAEKKPDHRKQK